MVDAVAAAYAAPGRHYHTLEHLAELAAWFVAVGREGPGWRDPNTVFAALLAHDAVYDVARTDNEAASAALARSWAPQLGADPEQCAALVLATASHGAGVPADDSDLALFLDCDLAVLGAPAERYDRYEADVAREYTAVIPEAAFRGGRARFLAAMAARDRTFHTDWFEHRLGQAARTNLSRAAAACSAGLPWDPALGRQPWDPALGPEPLPPRSPRLHRGGSLPG